MYYLIISTDRFDYGVRCIKAKLAETLHTWSTTAILPWEWEG